ncbi:hypothetical protein B9Z55_020212 [Caenorhabditis nigoni]|uniref:Uncharacterized protein n=1 Tax=Caenorhabditis nigoni TaxID=1611254 RepID=A0A2G5TLV1_9PELO|nr:hypothetical protein B9Z55_020212 [Caenorhabditis nigoni]
MSTLTPKKLRKICRPPCFKLCSTYVVTRRVCHTDDFSVHLDQSILSGPSLSYLEVNCIPATGVSSVLHVHIDLRRLSRIGARACRRLTQHYLLLRRRQFWNMDYFDTSKTF